jgi:hypothetical protein
MKFSGVKNTLQNLAVWKIHKKNFGKKQQKFNGVKNLLQKCLQKKSISNFFIRKKY